MGRRGGGGGTPDVDVCDVDRENVDVDADVVGPVCGVVVVSGDDPSPIGDPADAAGVVVLDTIMRLDP